MLWVFKDHSEIHVAGVKQERGSTVGGGVRERTGATSLGASSVVVRTLAVTPGKTGRPWSI